MAPPSDFVTHSSTILEHLIASVTGQDRARRALETLWIEPDLAACADRPSRAHIAMALNAALFVDLLERVPTASRYVEQAREAGEPIVFDHGALRTIDGPCGALPSGYAAFSRILAPLGYEVAGTYPLPALRMTGRAFVQRDFPETIPQFFVSELHLSELPEPAQRAAARIFSQSSDPIGTAEWAALDALSRDGACSMVQAETILKGLMSAFARQHPAPALGDYQALLENSKEGAWIATEGNAFNHATTRVPDVERLSEQLKASGYPLKPTVEISRNGHVRQTAFLADKVMRPFVLPGGEETEMQVPGSFYEFITRDIDPATARLDLTFDSGNATGIFAVTRDR